MSRRNRQPSYAPQNSNPPSTIRPELMWEGKNDERGSRREVDIAGCAVLRQRIEDTNQPRREGAAAVSLVDGLG